MNRGSPTNCLNSRVSGAGFNEAPIHESGKLRRDMRDLLHEICFNEAPIHESGKSQPAPPRHGARACFNEAPIHESGK